MTTILMKHYTDSSGSIYGFPTDGSQDHLITQGMLLIDEATADSIRADIANKNMAAQQNSMSVTQLADRQRAQRDILLTKCDYTQMPDSPVTNKAAWATYRQALRDLPAQPLFPTNTVWPTPPQG